MTELLFDIDLDKKPNAIYAAQMRTLAVLGRLDTVRKRNLLLFFIGKSFIDLKGANLSKIDLRNVNLNGIVLNGVNPSGANLSKANLSMADLATTDLSMANLKTANLSGLF